MAAGAAARGNPPTIKRIVVYRNGDKFFSGRRVVVNRRQLTTFDSLLAHLTRVLQAPFGAVRRLYTPIEGQRVQRLDDLKNGGVYVAAGNETFKKLNYCEISATKPQTKKKEQIQPVVHSNIITAARWKNNTNGTCTINVFTNGEVLVPPIRVWIPKNTLKNWGNVLSMVTEKVRLRTGAVRRLYTVDGQLVRGPDDLKHKQNYVAVGAGKFKPLPYERCIPCNDNITENNISEDSHDTQPAVRKTRHAKDPFAHAGFGEDLEHTARGQMKKHAAELERTKQQRQVSRSPVLFSMGEGSVFNAQNKRSEVAGAMEVQEDSELKVDLPIDQVEAMIVDEELEDVRCCTSPCKASLHESDRPCVQRSLSAGSRRDEAGRRECFRFCRIRSRVSRLFKGRWKH